MPLLLLQDDRQSEDLPLGSRGGVAIPYHFPVDGEYLIKVELRTNWQDYILGMGTAHQLDVRIDGGLVERFTVGGEARGRPAPVTFTIAEPGDPEWEAYLHEADDRLEVRVPVEAGPRVVGVSFVRNVWEPEGILTPRQAGEVLSNDEAYHGNAAVSSVAIGGPYEATGPGDTPSRRAIFACRPDTPADTDERACAAAIVSRLARRAYRRPLAPADLDTLLGFFESGRESGGSFDAGIQLALERMLVDPDFLLRIERDPAGAAPGQPYRLSGVEVASRLSFFLWGSIPDGPLLDAAERGALIDPAELEAQVRRMLADPRAGALVDDFAMQWLHVRNLEDVKGDPVPFPDFDDNLVEAFRHETTLFLASTLREDRSVLDLLDADYTFVNERLARHYGIPGVYGSRFRRVVLPDLTQRGGLLGHGGLLALTSYPTRTSPVLRGKWLLDTILGAPPPSPPADVPALPEPGAGGRNRLGPRAARAPPAGPRLRHVPRLDRPARLRAGAVRRPRRVADRGRVRQPHRRGGDAAERTGGGGHGRPPGVAAGAARAVRRHGDREAAVLCPRPQPGALRSTDRARRRPRRRGRRLPLVRAGRRDREEPGVPDAERAERGRGELDWPKFWAWVHVRLAGESATLDRPYSGTSQVYECNCSRGQPFGTHATAAIDC